MGLDEILNFVVPAILVLVVCVFIWTKILAPTIWPWMKGMLDSAKEKGDHARGKEIFYDGI